MITTAIILGFSACLRAFSLLADHLWQSTLFAIFVALCALFLHKQRANLCFALWLTASLKFLVPFALLTVLGSSLRLTFAVPAAERLSKNMPQPFFFVFAPAAYRPIPQSAASVNVAAFLPSVLLIVWFLGFAVVLYRWFAGWRRVRLALRDAARGDHTRERELLGRAQSLVPVSQAVRLVVSRTALEPGIVGIWRPILLLPQGIPQELTDSELVGVLAHELCHVRRHDNLIALLHTLAQSIFWFYPLLWFIGQQLWRERERACDQAVLDCGASPQVYGESILKVCRFYLASPPACAAGISGSQLRKRMEEIMNHQPFRKLSRLPDWSLRALLALALLCPLAYGSLRPFTRPAVVSPAAATTASPDQIPAYESVSIALSQNPNADIAMMLLKPEGFSAKNVTLRGIILAAYGLQDSQLIGGPDWVNTAKFDIEAKAPAEAVEAAKREGDRPLLPGKMVQALLADRFRLVLGIQEASEPVLALVVAQTNPNLAVARPGDDYANGFKGADGKPVGPGIWENANGGQIQLTAQGLPVFILVRFCSEVSKRLVVDRTGLEGKYDFQLTVPAGGDPANPMFNFTEQSLNAALQQQLGLKLEQQNAPVQHVTIQHAARIAEEK